MLYYCQMNILLEEIGQRLERIERALSIHDGQEKYIDLDNLCKLMGIAKRTYYQNHADYNFTKYKFGRKLRFDREQVIAWMNKKISSTT